MRFVSILKSLVLAVLLIQPSLVFGDSSMKCGRELVRLGASEYEVLKKCGEPTYRKGNKWIFDWGYGKALQIVIFIGGKAEYFEKNFEL